jgi:predicted O-methyltransferase YrrM
LGLYISGEIDRYIEEHTTPQDKVLEELDRFTNLNHTVPQMLSGRVQGKFLEMISDMIAPLRILEIGTYTGYSAICLARGLRPGGKVITIDVNVELEDTIRNFISQAGMTDIIDFRLGSALDIIPDLEETFDLVFIDADKENYSNYYRLVFPKLRPGGYILADNVLWDGKVLDSEKDRDTQGLVDFSNLVQNDPGVENVLLSIRDGIMLARKLQ